jgi:NitT/TauT family transport system ATP-binding protein
VADTTRAPIATLASAIVRYGAAGPAIGPVDLTIRPGEIVALVGASGAGKSTTLRLLAGLETAASGGVTLAAAKGRTAFVFQSPTLMPWADAVTNVALPLNLSGAPDAEARRRATQALIAVGLGDRLTARPAQLSGGMAMRVSLARALVTEPELLLLDEPFAALDSITRRGLVEDLHRLWAARGPAAPLAIVFVTHDVDEAVYLASRVVVLSAADGQTVEGITLPGPLPRAPDWRLDPAYRQSTEAVARALAGAMTEPLKVPT